MAQTGSERESRIDLLLGKMALERGWVDQEQLRAVLAAQALGVARGRKVPRSVGVILAEKKFLQDVQVQELLRDIDARLGQEKGEKQRDVFFGQILVDADLVAPLHVDECLLAQAEMIERGDDPVPRLGELLVERRYATPADIEQAVSLQKAMNRVCLDCGRSSSLSGMDGPAACPYCKGRLEAEIGPSSLSFSVAAPSPPPVEEAPSKPTKIGRYVIERTLGRGGCGVVYKARDSQLDRIVALKLMHRESGGSSTEVERFIREAQVSARLSHPNIVQVYEAGVVDGHHFIAMECIEGSSMAQWRRSGSITIRQQVRVLKDVALAVHAAHQQGITHRDLKPHNVMVDPRNKPFVMDFGLAKRAGGEVSVSLTVEGHILGTPSYMSPEQARGKKSISRLTDIWSLGIMLYEVLAGRPPFRGDTPMATLMKILRDPLPPLATAAPGVMNGPLYRPLQAVCTRALQKEPGERYPSAEAFAADLGKWLKGDEVKAAPRRKRTLPKWAPAAAIGALALLSTLLILTMPSRAPKWEAELKRAAQYIQEGRPEEALRLFDQVLDMDPGNKDAIEGRAYARFRMGGGGGEEKAVPPERPALPAPPPDGTSHPLRWLLMGPFPNRGINGAYEPERKFDPDAVVRAGSQPLKWRIRDAQIVNGGAGMLDLAPAFSPNTDVVVYAVTHVWSPAAASVRLLVGSDDGVKIWVNDEIVHTKDVFRGLKVDEDAVEARLRPGWNYLLFKVTQGKMGFGLCVRLEGPQGTLFEPYGKRER